LRNKFTRDLLGFILMNSSIFIGLLSGWKAGFLLMFVALMANVIFVMINKNLSYTIPKEIKVYGILVVLSLFSSFFAIDMSFSMDVLWKIIASFLIMIFCIQYVQSFNSFIKIINYYLIGSLILTFYNIYFYVPSVLRELPYGGVNPVALIMFGSICLVILLTFYNKKRWLLALPFYLYLLFLTESQKSILSLVIILIVFSLLVIIYIKTTKFIKYLVFSCFLLSLSIYILSNFSVLDKSSNRTFATILTLYTGEKVEGAASGSTGEGLRTDLKNKGWDYFSDNPILGYGLNNFRVLYGREKGLYAYSHHTPIELGIAYGFMGILLYYAIYFLVLKKLLTQIRRYRYSITAFLFSIIFALIIIGFYMQTYFDATVHFIIVITLLANNNLYQQNLKNIAKTN